MEPDLEVVQIRRGESFKAWSPGYPYRTVRWHFHPEYELHHVVATRGRYFVGDFIGEFEPGNLVLTGPNLPHNWVSELPDGVEVPLRCRIVQFSQDFIGNAMTLLPELGALGHVARTEPAWRLVSAGDGGRDRAGPGRVARRHRRTADRIVHDHSRCSEPRQRRAHFGQLELSARSVRLHVGGDQQGAGPYRRDT